MTFSTHPEAVRSRRRYAEQRQAAADAAVLLSKEDAPCCRAKVDQYGRWPIGLCGPDCVRRDHTRWAR